MSIEMIETEGFNAGTITASSMALAVVLGAQNDDLATIDNKLEVANEFTAQVDGRPLTDAGFGVGPFAATYEGTDDAVAARDVLVNVIQELVNELAQAANSGRTS